jgi:ParB family transcriptional regulator, chromosome partitioning protein
MKKPSITQLAMLVSSKPAGASQAATNVPTEASTPNSPIGEHLVKPRSGPSTMMSFMEKDSETKIENKKLSEQNAQLKVELDVWADSLLTKKVSPDLISPSKYANRHPDSFEDQEFLDLLEEIKSSGGNIQPIKVRPIVGSDPQRYEVVFGHRRHEACKRAGVDVLVMVESITDQALFEQMDRENRQRANLRPWEQGEMYRKALEDGLYKNMAQMAESLGQSKGNVSVALKIVSLPAEVVAAFPSPLEIQYRWATPLAKLCEEEPALVLDRAKKIKALRDQGQRIDATKTYYDLFTQEQAKEQSPQRQISAGQTVFTCTSKKNGNATFEFSKLTPEQLKAVEAAIVSALT